MKAIQLFKMALARRFRFQDEPKVANYNPPPKYERPPYPNRWNGPPPMPRPASMVAPLTFPEIDPSMIPTKGQP